MRLVLALIISLLTAACAKDEKNKRVQDNATCEIAAFLNWDFGSGLVKSNGYDCTDVSGESCRMVRSTDDESVFETTCEGPIVVTR